MADIFDQISTQQAPPQQTTQGDIFDHITSGPDQPVVMQNPGNHPTYGAPEYNFNPLTSAIRGINSGIVNTAETAGGAIAKSMGASPEARESAKEATTNKFGGDFAGIKPSMPGTLANVTENAANTGVQSLPGLAASTAVGPVAGFGAAGALRGYAEDKNPLAEGAKDALFTKLFMMAGGAGGNAFVNAAKKFGIPEAQASAEFLKRAGNAVGAGSFSGVTSGGDPNAIIQGTAIGGAFPSDKPSMSDLNPLNSKFYTGKQQPLTPEQHDAIINDEGSKTYRNILNPGKGIINKVEIKSGKDINDSMSLAARMALPIESAEGKLDNSKAIDIVKKAPQPLYDAQNEMLASNPEKQFNLDKLADNVKKSFDDPNSPGYIKDATGAAAAKAKVDNEINAEILRHGTPQEDGSIDPNIDAITLNKIKQGMWGKSYNPLEPNANDAARQIGFSAKDAIEKAFPDAPIQDTNVQIGRYLQLQRILEATHGQVVQGGKIGKYLAKGTGAVVGGAVGMHLPFLGEIVGPIAGMEAGGRVSDIMNDPARITGNWAKKLAGLNVEQLPPSIQAVKNDSLPINPIAKINPAEFPKSAPIISELNPLKNIQKGLEVKVKEGKFGNKGQIDTSGRNAEDLNLELQRNMKYKNSREYRSDKSYAKMIDSKISELQQAIKEVAKGPLGLGIGLATAGTLALGATNANAGHLGAHSVFNPTNNPAQQTKKAEVLKMPAGQYTMTNEGKGVKGKSGWPYIDTLGNKTVGYGFKMDGDAAKYIPQAVKDGHRAMTEAEMTNAFNHIYPKAISRAEKFAGKSWQYLSPNQQKALTDMSYQMEGHLNGFHNLKAAIQSGHFNTAAREILNSKYARNDAPNRAKQNAILIQQ